MNESEARCVVCSAPLTYSGRGRRDLRYCSRSCKEQGRQPRYIDRKKERQHNACLQCGASLEGRHSHVMYCSANCKTAYWRSQRPSQARENDRSCRCGASLAGKRSNVRWCSYRCVNLWNLYQITAPEVDALLELQGGQCAVCGTTEWGNGGTPSVDHCHNSGRIRGILCARCNGALGLMDDDTSRLRAAIDYLERHALTPE